MTGRIFRCAAPKHATNEDKQLLLSKLGVRDIVSCCCWASLMRCTGAAASSGPARASARLHAPPARAGPTCWLPPPLPQIDLRASEESDEDCGALIYASSIHYVHIRSRGGSGVGAGVRWRGCAVCAGAGACHCRARAALPQACCCAMLAGLA